MGEGRIESPVLVTGANGFIGTALCKGLIGAGYEVRGAVLSGTESGSLERLGVPVHPGDICRPYTLPAALKGVGTVFHLAALASDWAPWDRFMAINADGTSNVLAAARDAGAKRFVHMSSLAVHRFDGHVDGDEDTPVGNDVNGYCASKIVAESMVSGAQAKGWLETTIVRPGAIIVGPGDTTAFVHLAPALERGGLPLVDDGRHLTCYSHVGNLVDGMLLAASAPAAAGQTFILTDDRKVSLRAYLEATCRALGAKPRFRSVPAPLAGLAGWALENLWSLARSRTSPPINRYRVGLVSKDFHFSCAKAKRLLGYEPLVDLEQALAETVAWYREYQQTRAGGG